MTSQPPIPEYIRVWVYRFGNADRATDCDGRIIHFHEYGKLTAFGWEIDHTTPTILGGLDIYANKRPRHWRGNRSAGGILGGLINS